MRLIDLDKITVDSRVMQAIAQMLTHCKAKHDIQCTAGNCAECIASFFNDPANEDLHEIFAIPTVEKEAASRYINVDDFIADTRKAYCENCEHRIGMKNGKMQFVYEIGGVRCKACDIGDMIDAVDDYPTADVAPVAHGRWIEVYTNTLACECLYCSICGYREFEERTYCSHCGAKMDESEDKDDESER